MENPFEIILNKLNNVESLLTQMQMQLKAIANLSVYKKENEIMNTDELAKYIKHTKATIYGYISRREIPYYKGAKRIYFKKEEIDNWLTNNRIPTNKEIQEESIYYMKKYTKKNR